VVVVGVDDASARNVCRYSFVQHIVQRGAAKVFLTVRDGESIPAAVQEIWKGGRFEPARLQPLSSTKPATLLSADLWDGSVDPDAAQRLWNLTRLQRFVSSHHRLTQEVLTAAREPARVLAWQVIR